MTMKLGGERSADGGLSLAPALGHTGGYCRRSFLLRSPCQALSQQLDDHHRPFRAIRDARIHDPWARVGIDIKITTECSPPAQPTPRS